MSKLKLTKVVAEVLDEKKLNAIKGGIGDEHGMEYTCLKDTTNSKSSNCNVAFVE